RASGCASHPEIQNRPVRACRFVNTFYGTLNGVLDELPVALRVQVRLPRVKDSIAGHSKILVSLRLEGGGMCWQRWQRTQRSIWQIVTCRIRACLASPIVKLKFVVQSLNALVMEKIAGD